MNGGPSGFHNAPVTRTLVIACALLTILIGIQAVRPRLGYHIRMFSERFSCGDRTSSLLASGPYGLIFASFIPFYFDIPVTTRFHVFGFHFSDKSFIYLAGLQLLLSSWKRSILPGLCGVLAGSLYRINVFGIRRLKLPQFITSSFSRLSRSSSSSSSSTTSSRNILGNVPSFMGRQPERNRPTFAPPASVAEPPEDSIALLMSMGFNRNSAREALMRARNDINVASNILLETQSH